MGRGVSGHLRSLQRCHISRLVPATPERHPQWLYKGATLVVWALLETNGEVCERNKLRTAEAVATWPPFNAARHPRTGAHAATWTLQPSSLPGSKPRRSTSSYPHRHEAPVTSRQHSFIHFQFCLLIFSNLLHQNNVMFSHDITNKKSLRLKELYK